MLTNQYLESVRGAVNSVSDWVLWAYAAALAAAGLALVLHVTCRGNDP